MKKIRVSLPDGLMTRVRGYAMFHRVPLLRVVDEALRSWTESKGSLTEDWMLLTELPVSEDVWEAATTAAKLSGVSIKGAVRQALEQRLAALDTDSPAPAKIELLPEGAIRGNHENRLQPSSNEVTCLRCGNKWTPRKSEPSYCPRCRSSEWNDAWKCKTCGEWFTKRAQRGDFCMKHQIQPLGFGSPPPRPPKFQPVPAEMDEPLECAQCDQPYTASKNYPCCSEECTAAWKAENQ